MRGSTHAAIGANAVWIPFVLGMSVYPWYFLVGALAALLPDLDASESKIKHLKFGIYIGRSKVWLKPFWPIAFIISKIFRHRGILHSFVFALTLFISLMLLIPQDFSSLTLVIIIGYASHYILDALTKAGIEFFWPWKKRIGLLPRRLRVKTGGLLDNIFLLAGSVGVIIFLYLNI